MSNRRLSKAVRDYLSRCTARRGGKVKGKPRETEETREYLGDLGREGGKAGGARKARSPEQARKAALARWGAKKRS